MAKIKIGKIPVYKGEYDNNTTYNRLNQVTYLGTTFLSIVDDNLGHPPAEKSEDGGEILYINTNYWDIVAKGIDNVEERTATNNSMGYKILKKNKSFIEQVTEENTIYEIRYNFTLTEDITIPANCVLKFDGGSINGAYTITGNNTGIQAGLVKIFNINVTLDGSWNVTEAYPEWFGAVGNKTTNDFDAIQKCINSFKNTVLTHSYKINSTIVIPNYKSIQALINHDIELIFDDSVNIAITHTSDTTARGIIIKNIIISKPVKTENSSAILITRGTECNFEDIIVANGFETAFDFRSIWLCGIKMCTAMNSDIGFNIGKEGGSSTSINFISCYSHTCGIAYKTRNIVYSTFTSCAADHCEKIYKFRNSKVSLISCGSEWTKGHVIEITEDEGTNINGNNIYVQNYNCTIDNNITELDCLIKISHSIRNYIDRNIINIDGFYVSGLDKVNYLVNMNGDSDLYLSKLQEIPNNKIFDIGTDASLYDKAICAHIFIEGVRTVANTRLGYNSFISKRFLGDSVILYNNTDNSFKPVYWTGSTWKYADGTDTGIS